MSRHRVLAARGARVEPRCRFEGPEAPVWLHSRPGRRRCYGRGRGRSAACERRPWAADASTGAGGQPTHRQVPVGSYGSPGVGGAAPMCSRGEPRCRFEGGEAPGWLHSRPGRRRCYGRGRGRSAAYKRRPWAADASTGAGGQLRQSRGWRGRADVVVSGAVVSLRGRRSTRLAPLTTGSAAMLREGPGPIRGVQEAPVGSRRIDRCRWAATAVPGLEGPRRCAREWSRGVASRAAKHPVGSTHCRGDGVVSLGGVGVGPRRARGARGQPTQRCRRAATAFRQEGPRRCCREWSRGVASRAAKHPFGSTHGYRYGWLHSRIQIAEPEEERRGRGHQGTRLPGR